MVQENYSAPFFYLIKVSPNPTVNMENSYFSDLNFDKNQNNTIFAVQNRIGTLAEWLGAGLQNRLRRFESAKYL